MEPPKTVKEAQRLLSDLVAQAEVNTIRYRDVTKRLDREDLSQSQITHLVQKRNDLDIEINLIRPQITKLIAAIEQAQGGAHAPQQAEIRDSAPH